MRINPDKKKKYWDISWLMNSVDVIDVLERLGCEEISDLGDEIQCLCPDHYHYVQRISSHPNWICNIDSGMTYCRTEHRASNLLWTVCRVLHCSPEEAVKFMTGNEVNSLYTASLKNRISKINSSQLTEEIQEEPPVVYLDQINSDLNDRYISKRCYDYFIKPPEKHQTNILPETVDYYKVIEKISGFYKDRAIIPFFLRKELQGFCAIDLLGKKEWLLRHPLAKEDEYIKTLTAKNFKAKRFLFGFDECEKNPSQLIVTEGPREVMKLWQEGFTNSVGCLKADLSDDQIFLLTELAPEEIILIFDGDEAGWRAADKNYWKLKSLFKVRRCYLSFGKDPKNFNGSEIQKFINKGIT